MRASDSVSHPHYWPYSPSSPQLLATVFLFQFVVTEQVLGSELSLLFMFYSRQFIFFSGPGGKNLIYFNF